MRCPTWRALEAEALFPQPNYSTLHRTLFPGAGFAASTPIGAAAGERGSSPSARTSSQERTVEMLKNTREISC